MADEARTAILDVLRRAAAGRDEVAARHAVAERLATRPRNTVPARGRLEGAALTDLFVRMAEAVGAVCSRLSDERAVPAAVAGVLAQSGFPARVRVAEAVSRLDWASAGLEAGSGAARADDAVSVTGAVAGIAETGSLLVASGPAHPSGLNFLPTLHIAVLPLADIVGSYEQGWDRLRAKPGGMPRNVSLITGPSRTADIEMTLQFHAHGPGRLHILLVGPATAGTGDRPGSFGA